MSGLGIDSNSESIIPQPPIDLKTQAQALVSTYKKNIDKRCDLLKGAIGSAQKEFVSNASTARSQIKSELGSSGEKVKLTSAQEKLIDRVSQENQKSAKSMGHLKTGAKEFEISAEKSREKLTHLRKNIEDRHDPKWFQFNKKADLKASIYYEGPTLTKSQKEMGKMEAISKGVQEEEKSIKESLENETDSNTTTVSILKDQISLLGQIGEQIKEVDKYLKFAGNVGPEFKEQLNQQRDELIKLEKEIGQKCGPKGVEREGLKELADKNRGQFDAIAKKNEQLNNLAKANADYTEKYVKTARLRDIVLEKLHLKKASSEPQDQSQVRARSESNSARARELEKWQEVTKNQKAIQSCLNFLDNQEVHSLANSFFIKDMKNDPVLNNLIDCMADLEELVNKDAPASQTLPLLDKARLLFNMLGIHKRLLETEDPITRNNLQDQFDGYVRQLNGGAPEIL